MVLGGPSSPLRHEMARGGSWLAACAEPPSIAVAPVMGVAGWLPTRPGLRAGRLVSTPLCSGTAIFGVIAAVDLNIFPFILPSWLDPRPSLTVWSSSSSHLAVFAMLVSTLIFVPMILFYAAWAYRGLRDKVTERDVAASSRFVCGETMTSRGVARGCSPPCSPTSTG